MCGRHFVTRSTNRECPRGGCGYILRGGNEDSPRGKSSELPTGPCLSPHLKYTINMLRRRPEIAGYHAAGIWLSFSPYVRFLLSSFLPPLLPSCQFLQPLLSTKKTAHDRRRAQRRTRARARARVLAFHFYYRVVLVRATVPRMLTRYSSPGGNLMSLYFYGDPFVR